MTEHAWRPKNLERNLSPLWPTYWECLRCGAAVSIPNGARFDTITAGPTRAALHARRIDEDCDLHTVSLIHDE